MFDAAVQSLLKLCILVGVVLVGGMAYHLYGPPAGEATALLDRIVREARLAVADWQGVPVAQAAPTPTPAVSQPAHWGAGSLTSAPPTELQPAPLAAAQPGVHEPMAPLAPLPVATAPSALPTPKSVEELLEQLRSLGVEDLELSAWGAEGALHRFACCAPLPGDSGFVRRFDAIEADAQLAVARVFDQVRQWRGSQAGMIR